MGKEKNKKRLELLLSIIFVCSLCLSIWSVNIYRDTVIEWTILVLPTIIGIVVTTFIFKEKLLKIGTSVGTIFFICLFCGGACAHFSFMILNQKFTDTLTISKTFIIEKNGVMANGHEQYVIVDFYGLKKQVFISRKEMGNISKFSKIRLVYSKGLFGYDVIKEKTLVN